MKNILLICTKLTCVKVFYNYFFVCISILLLTNCARTGSPSGGPKDEDAPLFVTSTPPYGSTNFNKKEIKLSFNEFITLKDVSKQLIVSPPLKIPLSITPQGSATKSLKLKILDTLKENTTYILNFGNAVQDNNEGNKIEDFKYIFSTGNYIDSLTLKGTVKDAYYGTSTKNANILLYKIDSTFNDSIIFKKKPNYVTTTKDSINFKFTNLKKGKYLMISLVEKSNDYLFNPRTDKIGIYKDTIILPQDSIIKKPLAFFKELPEYKFIRAKEVSKGKIVFGYQGSLDNFNVKLLSKTPKDYLAISKFEPNKDTLNYWFKNIETDSLNFIVSNDIFLDTVTVKLRKKKIDSLTLSASTRDILHLKDTFFVNTNNPILNIDKSKLSLKINDSIPLNFETAISKTKNSIAFIFQQKPMQNYKLSMFPEALEDIFECKNDTINYNFKTLEIEDYGKITLDIVNKTSENLIIELLEKDKIIERKFIIDSKNLIFDFLKPSKYSIRAVIDSNKNKKWDTGNYLEKRLPEQIIYFKKDLELRANYYLNEKFTVNTKN